MVRRGYAEFHYWIAAITISFIPMGLLRRIIKGIEAAFARRSPAPEDEDPSLRVTREAAIETARSMAARDLCETESAITYVGFVAAFDDYARCAFLPDDKGWVFQFATLPQEERLLDEKITDEQIIAAARRGNRINAIRMYRNKYGASLAEAVEGLRRLEG